MPRICNFPSCGKMLVKRDNETQKEYVKRIYCIDRCKDLHKKAVKARSLRARRIVSESHDDSI